MKNITIGLPRALLFYQYQTLWTTFFKELGCDIVVSDKSNKEILEEGTKKSIDEACLSMKLFLGHIKNLENKCDYILVPRLYCIEKKEKLCTNFSVLYDLVNTLFKDVELLHYNIDVEKNENELLAFLKIGKQLGFTTFETMKAYKKAKRKEKEREEWRIEKQQARLDTEKLKILIVGHPYNLYDELIGRPIIRYLKSMDIEVIYSDIYPKDELEIESETISKDVYWTYNRYLLGAITHYKRSVDGIILLTTFPCGPDSLCNEMVIRKVKSVPILPIIIDELNAEAGLYTRLESFVDILNQQKGNVISHE